MIQRGVWQVRFLRDLTRLLEARLSVRALLVQGSCADPRLALDPWSDVDVTLVVADGALNRYFSATDWLTPLGEVYTVNRSVGDTARTLRVCFTDFRRLDYVLLQESDFPAHTIASNDIRVLFTRSPLVTDATARERLVPLATPTPAKRDLGQIGNDFWFKGMLATDKVIRNDLLIASHLTLALAQDVLVLQMWRRDRALGTTHHRAGGWGNAVAAEVGTALDLSSPVAILASIERLALLFDQLAREWEPDHRDGRGPLLEWIAYTREALASAEDVADEVAERPALPTTLLDSSRAGA